MKDDLLKIQEATEKFQGSDCIMQAIEALKQQLMETHKNIRELTQQYNEALESELGPILPSLQKSKWVLHILCDVETIIADERGEFHLLATPLEDNIKKILKKLPSSSRTRVVDEGVTASAEHGTICLSIDRGGVIQNAEWCLNNKIEVLPQHSRGTLADITRCQEKINVIERLLRRQLPLG